MKLLSNNIKKNNGNDLAGDNVNIIPIAILQTKQLEDFSYGLLNGLDSLDNKVFAKTGSYGFTNKLENTKLRKSKKNIGVDLYLIALEALHVSINGMGGIKTLELLKFGNDIFFNEGGYRVGYEKVLPLYERNGSKDSQGKFKLSEGIVQIYYLSPIGSFVIKQNQLNNQLFEIYFSNVMSKKLYKRLTKALEIALNLKQYTLENNSIDKYNIHLINDDEVKQIRSK